MADKNERLVKVLFEKSNYGWGEYMVANVEFVKRNDDYTRLETPDDDLIGLTIRAQMTKGDQDGKFYGYCVTAKLETSDISRLESTAKSMRRIESKLEKLSQVEGSPRSFGEWLVKVCQILKVTSQVKKSRYSDQWVCSSLGDMRYEIENVEYGFAHPN